MILKATPLLDEYHTLLKGWYFLPDREDRKATIEKCRALIQNFDKNELDYALTITVLRATGESNDFNDLLKVLLAKGANPNILLYEGDHPPLFTAIERGNAGLVKVLLEGGADPKGTFYMWNYQFSPIHYCFKFRNFNGKFLEQVLRALIEGGCSTELPNETSESYHMKNVIQKIQHEIKIEELERENRELKDYIVELECRPPELGGPEYEAARQRWETRN